MSIFDVNKLTDEELIGQTLCPEFSVDDPIEDVKQRIKNDLPGSIYLYRWPIERIKEITDYANSILKYPLLIITDVEAGPGDPIEGEAVYSAPMAWGAADDENLMYRAGELAGKIVRSHGMHLALGPVADINLNFRNPLVNTRSVSDSKDQVKKIIGSFMKGMEKEHLLTTIKHFPGDGVDDRDQHFLTTINSLSKEEWMSTFGDVYKYLIDEGASCFMVAHISLPCFEKECDPFYGYLPATLSKSLMTDLLKNKLGFKGAIISDAMSMIGTCSVCKDSELAYRFLEAGGDIVLFNEKKDKDFILQALHEGKITKERLLDAVNRVLYLKKKALLFTDDTFESTKEDSIEAKEIAYKIGEKSIKFVRNVDKILPLKLEKGSKILILSQYLDLHGPVDKENTHFLTFIDELRKRDFIVDVYHKIDHYKIDEIIDLYDACMILCDTDPYNCRGSDFNCGWWDGIMYFWRGYVFRNKNLVYISFGDPYRLYQHPFLRTYVNACSRNDEVQKAAVKVILGETKEQGKNPVSLEGFFKREV